VLNSAQRSMGYIEEPAIVDAPGWGGAMLSAKPIRFVFLGGKLCLADAIAFLAVFSLSATIGGAVHPHLLWILGAIYFAVAVYGAAYSPAIAADAVRSTQRAWLALLITFCAVGTFAMLEGRSIDHVSSALLPSLTGLACTLGVARTALALMLGSAWWSERSGRHRTILLVDGDASPFTPMDGLVIDAVRHGLRADVHDPDVLERLGALAGRADRLVVSCPQDRRAAWAAALRGANVPVELLVEEVASLAPIGAGSFHGQATLKVAGEPLSFSDRITKRLFDIVVAGTGLLLLTPFLLFTALAIRLDSPGPALFRQPRIGRGNRQFRMHKFRSMRVDTQDLSGSRLTQGRSDDRVTRIGRIIRSTSIDELPQLIDVLRGDMSIVGPRPHALGAKAGDKLYWEVDTAYWHRHAVKPGMTGLAQVRGFRGTTFVDADLQNRLDADLEYLRDWSLGKDIKIVFRTVMALAGRSVF